MFAGLAALLLWVIIGGLAPTIVKLLLLEIPPITLTFLRFTIASVVLFPIYWRQRPKNITQAHIIELLGVGTLGGACNVGLYAYSIQFTSVITAQVLYATVPIVVAILGFFLIKEKISQYQLVGAIIGFLGVIFLFYQSMLSQDLLTLGTPFGNVLILIGVFAWSLYTVLSRKLSKTYSPITISFASFVSAVPILGLLMPIEMRVKDFSLQMISVNSFLGLLFLGIVSSVIIYFLYQFGIKKTSAFIASLVFYLAPLSVILPAGRFLHEKVTIYLLIGAVLILFGVFLATTYTQLKRRI